MPVLPGPLGFSRLADAHSVWIPKYGKVLIHLYTSLFIVGGHVLLPILLATFVFSKHAKRHPTLLNLLCTLSLASVFSCLLQYAGREIGPQPSKLLCTVQAAVEYGVVPMWAMATFALVFNVWTHFVFATGTIAHRPSGRVTAALIPLPYITFLGLMGGSLYLGLKHPENVSRDRRFFFCSVYNKPFILVQGYISCGLFLIVSLFEVHIAYALFRNRRALQRAGHATGLDIKVVFRILTFGLYVVVALIGSVVSTMDVATAVPDLVFSLAPLTAFFVFGTQSDVIQTWTFWHAPPRSSQRSNPMSFSSAPSSSFSRETAGTKAMTRDQAKVDIGPLDTHMTGSIALDTLASSTSLRDASKAHFFSYDPETDASSDHISPKRPSVFE